MGKSLEYHQKLGLTLDSSAQSHMLGKGYKTRVRPPSINPIWVPNPLDLSTQRPRGRSASRSRVLPRRQIPCLHQRKHLRFSRSCPDNGKASVNFSTPAALPRSVFASERDHIRRASRIADFVRQHVQRFYRSQGWFPRIHRDVRFRGTQICFVERNEF